MDRLRLSKTGDHNSSTSFPTAVHGAFDRTHPFQASRSLSWNRRFRIMYTNHSLHRVMQWLHAFYFQLCSGCFTFKELTFLCHWVNLVWQAQAKHGRTPSICILTCIVKGGSGGTNILTLDTSTDTSGNMKSGQRWRLSWANSWDFNIIVCSLPTLEITLVFNLSDSVRVEKKSLS